MILTIDVGLKNLAMCIMGCQDPKNMSTYNILLWQVFNTLEDEIHYCSAIQNNGKVCGKKSTMKHHSNATHLFTYTCKKHFPKDIPQLPKNHIKTKKVDDFLLQDIARIILTKVGEIYGENKAAFDLVSKVCIELQPKINNKMKLISHLIYGKFVEIYLDKNVPIRFVRASQKLKAYKGPPIVCNLKGAYAKRKFLSVQYTLWFLSKHFSQAECTKWKTIFESHSKKDDLGDVFLMALNAIVSKT